MKGRAARLVPVVVALSAADRARLSACLARIWRYREEAARLQAEARATAAGVDAPGMLAASRWQRLTLARSQEATRAAAELEPEASALSRRLARSLGREKAVAALAAEERAAARAVAERRAEDLVPRTAGPWPQSSASTVPGSSSVGTT